MNVGQVVWLGLNSVPIAMWHSSGQRRDWWIAGHVTTILLCDWSRSSPLCGALYCCVWLCLHNDSVLSNCWLWWLQHSPPVIIIIKCQPVTLNLLETPSSIHQCLVSSLDTECRLGQNHGLVKYWWPVKLCLLWVNFNLQTLDAASGVFGEKIYSLAHTSSSTAQHSDTLPPSDCRLLPVAK